MDDMSWSAGMALILSACLVAYLLWCALTARPSRRWIRRLTGIESGRERQRQEWRDSMEAERKAAARWVAQNCFWKQGDL